MSPSPPPAAKRKRTKVSNACQQCQSRKSRCELVTASGCHRCRVLGTDCSLARDEEADDSNQDVSPDSSHDPLKASAATELRTMRIKMERMESTIASLARLLAGAPQPRRPDGDGQHLALPADSEEYYMSASSRISYALQLPYRPSFPDVVAHGLVTSAGLREAIRITRETLPTYLPINLGLDSTDHLMRACVVHYAAHRSPTLGSPEDTRFRARVLHRVHVELAALPSAPASRDTLRACLVFSHAPGGTTVHALPSRADPFGASARAFASLEEVGVNEAVYILGRGAWTTVGVDNLIEDVQLYYAVYHRYAWDHMFTALSFFPPASSAPRLYSILPVERARSLGPETVHLVLESMLLDATQPLTEAVRALRIAPTFDSALVDNLLATIQATHDRLEAWREVVTTESLATTPYLLLHSYQLEAAMCLKLSSDSRHAIPLIVKGARFPAIISGFGKHLVGSCRVIAEQSVQQTTNLTMLPGFSLTICFLAYATLRQIKLLHPEIELPDMLAFRKTLEESHLSAEKTLTYIDNMNAALVWSDFVNSPPEPQEPAPFMWEDMFLGFDWNAFDHQMLGNI